MHRVRFDEPERRCDVPGPHPGHGPNGLRTGGGGEFDDDFPGRVPDMHVRRLVLTWRQEDDDAKPTQPEDSRHVPV